MLADQGADANFLSKALLFHIKQKISNIQSMKLNPAKIFRGVTRDACMTCKETGRTDVYLNRRHVSSLILHRIK